MTGPDDERELDDFLARRSVLHRRLADRDHNEPPAELDRLVLDHARAAINVPANAPIHRAPRWALPVSLAATVVLALAVVLNFARTQQGGYPVAASASPAATAAPAEEDSKVLRMAPIAPKSALADRSVDSFAAEPPAAEQELVPARRADAAANTVRLASNSAARAGGQLAASPETKEHSALLAKAQASAGASAAVQMPAEVHTASDAAIAVQAPTSPPPAAAPAISERARMQLAEKRAIVPAKREMTTLESVAVTGSRPARTEQSTPTAVVAAAPPPVAEGDLAEVITTGIATAAATADDAQPLSDKAKRADPQAWRREIERLRAAGKIAEAERELSEFRKAFPAEAASIPPRDPRPVR